jgi:hypothetical protein
MSNALHSEAEFHPAIWKEPHLVLFGDKAIRKLLCSGSRIKKLLWPWLPHLAVKVFMVGGILRTGVPRQSSTP